MLSPLVLLVLSADPSCPAELFRIERSKNANVVLYEAKWKAPGALDGDEPLVASWLMLAAKGQREPLTWLEQRMAYGFDVARASAGFTVTLRALKERAIRLVPSGSCAVATATIDGHEAALRRIFVKADDRELIPSVQYVELFGVDLKSGAPVYEKLQPR